MDRYPRSVRTRRNSSCRQTWAWPCDLLDRRSTVESEMVRLSASAGVDYRAVGGGRQIAARTVRLLHPFLEGSCRLVEHMGQLGPWNRSEQNGGGDEIHRQEQACPGRAACSLDARPYQTQGHAYHERNHEQIS